MRNSVLIWLVAGVCLGLMAALYGWRGGSSSLFLMLLFFFIMIQGAVVQLIGPKRAVVKRSWSPITPSVGDEVEVTLSITIFGGFPPMWLEVRDGFAGPASRISKGVAQRQGGVLWFAGFRREYSGKYILNELPRGIYMDCPITLTWGDAFGWFRRSLYIEGIDVLIVHPSLLRMDSSQLDGRIEGNDSEEIVSMSRVSTQLGGHIREYEAGDPLRRIHWKGSAKRGSLLTRIPDEAGQEPRYLLLDTRRGAYAHILGGKSAERMVGLGETNQMFEMAISAAATWLKREFTKGSGDVYFCYGDMESAKHLSGNRGLYDGLNLLAGVLQENGDSESVSKLFVRANQCRSGKPQIMTIITGIMTPEMAESILRLSNSGDQPEVWCVNRSAPGTEGEKWSTRLQEYGITIRYLTSHIATFSATEGGTAHVSA
ncbi:DUF58 domain-containing protein [Paenibacillus segetis]|uniref:DUF58 domain-containing protein n=1 Tax=Paenibacillus segetis TaxID=1325360 RepID=A0ABQ1YTY5_9BACL|nr:DUF58 domain-containing protein [Paenibacillus segetis]GGH38710.1 hypothetical protein GCM10008013_46980 [Paenibacillus segetis]